MEKQTNLEAFQKFGEALVKTLEKQQERPDQYVVAYKKKNEELIGYHADSFCNITQDILRAKRYAGTEPYKQLEIIWKNLVHTLEATKENSKWALGPIVLSAKKAFENLTKEDIYIDAIYLADGTPPHRFQAIILKPEDNG